MTTRAMWVGTIVLDAVYIVAALWIMGAFGCAAAPTRCEVATLAVGESLIAADVALSIATNGNPALRETNPFLGPHPSAGKFLLGGAVAMGANAAAWRLLPPPWRSVFEGALIGVEGALVVRGAVQVGMGVRW